MAKINTGTHINAEQATHKIVVWETQVKDCFRGRPVGIGELARQVQLAGWNIGLIKPRTGKCDFGPYFAHK